jgi:hypothetical protein
MNISGCLRQPEIIPVNLIDHHYLVGKSRRLKEGPVGSRWYELPVPDRKKTCQGQNRKNRNYKENLGKRME